MHRTDKKVAVVTKHCTIINHTKREKKINISNMKIFSEKVTTVKINKFHFETK